METIIITALIGALAVVIIGFVLYIPMPVKPETKVAQKMSYAQIRHLNSVVNHREREESEKKADNTAYEEE